MIGQAEGDEEGVGDGPAPSTAAMITSRRKPETRETSVQPPTVAMRLIMRCSGSCPLLAAER